MNAREVHSMPPHARVLFGTRSRRIAIVNGMKIYLIIVSVTLLSAASNGWAEAVYGTSCASPLQVSSLPFNALAPGHNPLSGQELSQYTGNSFVGGEGNCDPNGLGSGSYTFVIQIDNDANKIFKANQSYTINMDGSVGSAFAITVWRTTTGACNGFSLVACDEVPPAGYNRPAVQFGGITGGSYYIVLEGSPDATTLAVLITAGVLTATPGNGSCDTALPITSLPFQHTLKIANGGGFSQVVGNPDCILVQPTTGPALEAFYVIGPSAAAAGRTLTVNASTQEHSPVAVAVYQGGCPPTVSQSQCGFSTSGNASATFTADGLSTYYIMEEGFFYTDNMTLTVKGP